MFVIISYLDKTFQCSGSDLRAKLTLLLLYAMHHRHSRQWISAITRLLQREGVADER
jgi:hypothetical protein